LRPARPEDLRAVEAIEHASFGDPWSREALFGELEGDAMRLPLIAESDHGDVLGFLMAWRVVDQLHVLNVAIGPAARRRGVATALLREAARTGAGAGLVEVTLEVRRSNAGARDFYRHHGFAETGCRPRYYADNGEDAVIMTCAIADLLAGA